VATATILNRRDFLKTSAAGATALVIGFHLAPSAAAAPTAEDQEKKPANPFTAWVRITPDNQVTLILGKSEMGQGIMTALPMILAEELYLDWKQVKIEQAPTNPAIYEHGTGGSGSIAGSWMPLRQAGAAARALGGEERIENAADNIGGNSGAIVAHGDGHLLRGRAVNVDAKLADARQSGPKRGLRARARADEGGGRARRQGLADDVVQVLGPCDKAPHFDLALPETLERGRRDPVGPVQRIGHRAERYPGPVSDVTDADAHLAPPY